MATAVRRYLAAGSTDQGVVRANNEDRVYCDDVRGFFVVIDGMGGHEAGEHAAEIALERIRGRLERQVDSPEQRVREAITLANNAIYDAAQENPAWSGMACVLTVAVIEEGQVTVGHVGDSRLYRIKRGSIEKITHDHSPVGEREDSGELSEKDAMQHPRRNEVYRDVGSTVRTPESEDFIEMIELPFEPDSALLLCSDGLSDALRSDTILKIVEENAGDRAAAVSALIAAANEVGKDNVSAILVEGDAFARSFGKRSASASKNVSFGGPAVGEDTDRMSAPERLAQPSSYRRSAAYVFYGLLLGAVLGAAITINYSRYITRPSANSARPLTVSAPDTISAALERAQPGDRISVGPGTYSESIRLKSGVSLIAERAAEAVIEGSVTAEGVQYARLEGFKVRGDRTAIRITDSDVVISRDDISSARGAGIDYGGNSRGAIFACVIHNNAEGGVVVGDAAAPAIENNVISENGNTTASPRPGLFVHSALMPLITGNVFVGNGAEAIWAAALDSQTLARNYFFPSGKLDDHKLRIIPLQDRRP